MPVGKGMSYVPCKIEGKNVIEAAQERVSSLFDDFDTIVVCFSGGKDSTCVMNLALDEAKKRNRPLHVALCDEEIIDPDTEAYWYRLRERNEVTLYWICAQVRHTLRSIDRDCWYTWDPDYRDVWFRQIPPHAITDIPNFTKGRDHLHAAIVNLFRDPALGKCCFLTGIRVEEAYNRRRALLQAGGYRYMEGWAHKAKPIYDWKTTDVWWAIKEYGWDYSRIYDKMQRLGRPLKEQRVAPWGNVAGSRDSYQWAEFYPEAWERAMRRLPEIRDQARYGRTKLYQRGNEKPVGVTWQEWCMAIIASYPPEMQVRMKDAVAKEISRWYRTHTVAFPEGTLQEIDGKKHTKSEHSWQKLCQVLAKNDTSGGKIGGRSLM